MGFYTVRTVLDAILCVSKAAAAPVPQRIQRAVAKHAVEITRLYSLMAREILAGSILKKFVICHMLFLFRFANASCL